MHEPCFRLLVATDLLPPLAQLDERVLYSIGGHLSAPTGNGQGTHKTAIVSMKERFRGDRTLAPRGFSVLLLVVDRDSENDPLPDVGRFECIHAGGR
jgi:hypothetical protein